MKCLSTIFLTLFALSSHAVAEPKQPFFMLSGGATLNSQPRELKDNWPSGWHICAGVGVPLKKYLIWRTTTSFSRYPLRSDSEMWRFAGGSSHVRVEGDASSAIAASSQLQIGLVNRTRSMQLIPYGFIGPCFRYQRIGAYSLWTQGGAHIGSEWIRISPEHDIPDIGLEVGVGFNCMLTQRLGVFVEALRSVGLSSDPSCGAWMPVRVGLTFR